jgi:hypothetical protein
MRQTNDVNYAFVLFLPAQPSRSMPPGPHVPETSCHAARGHIRFAAHRVGELTRALFLALDGRILLRHRGANEAPSKPRRWWGQPGVAGGRWQLR